MVLEMSRSPSFSLKSLPILSIDRESLSQWIVSFCIIKFDLEQGQLIEECYPPGSLTQGEELEIAFSSFPDSVSQNQNRSSIHDCIFFFRFRKSEPCKHNFLSTGGENTANYGDYWSSYLYGYVFNRQRHDERLKRGGEQKSVVIVSHCPFSNVFRPLLQIVGPLYFDVGRKALEHIAGYVSQWPKPAPGKLMELPIGNSALKVSLPLVYDLPSVSGILYEDPAFSKAVPQGLFHDSDLFGIFKGILLQLWVLWELVLVGEPILVIAPSPPQCCEAVASLISLMTPLLCSIDFRPYFTIHDPEFVKLNSLQEGNTFPPMILGVTNLFFLKALRTFPHVVSVGSPLTNSTRRSMSSRSPFGRAFGGQERPGIQKLSLKRFSPSSLLSSVKFKRDGPLSLMVEHREAIWSSYVSVIKPDTSILNRLVDVGMSPRVEESVSVVNNEILRRHFLELTANFLSPFSPYFRVAAPAEGHSLFRDPPPLPPFNANEFLRNLSARGPGKFLMKRMRSNWLDLYRRFVEGKNFIPWFQWKRAVAEYEQHKLWRDARIDMDIQHFIAQMSELEIVDSFNAIERHLLGEIKMQTSNLGNQEFASTLEKLKGDLRTVFGVLPKDMQQLLLSNPQRASLLQ